MKPPYGLTASILRWITSISEKIGEAKASRDLKEGVERGLLEKTGNKRKRFTNRKHPNEQEDTVGYAD